MGKTMLPPGFRFHPTDEELVKYYLKRKVLRKKLDPQVIGDIDIYKYAPWDLPNRSCLRTRDLKWFFFCPREKKYAGGTRQNRNTGLGYWKTTGKDRPVYYKSIVVGKIKTLVFHRGKAPKGDRTDWVMHEYRIEEKELADRGIDQDTYVLCVIFKKDGPGPKNGAQYGAPFKEEEWDDDEEEEEVNGRDFFPFIGGCTQSFATPGDPSSSHVTFPSVPENMSSFATPGDPSSSHVTFPSVPENMSSFATPGDPSSSHITFPSVPENMSLGPFASCPLETLPPVHHTMVCDTGANADNSPIVAEDEEILALLTMFTEEGGFVPEQIENKADSCHKVDNIQGNSSLDANDFYNELGDLGNLAGLDQTGSDVIPNWCYTTFSVDQSYGHDNLSFLELIDLEAPLDCSSEFNGYKEIDCGTAYSNNNCESGDLYHSSNAFSVPALSQVTDIPDDRPDQFESQVNKCRKEGGADEVL
ncbi:hypothetical protein K2173_012084 [Erythroxylum novogranatense]|uniref:NAC domain-containing protein n=1 Tax=Erythroxylum novogranatense TaxID=1862640 RepID=A0AAV8TEV3_9ROSI|nr:hypothetical protein K2173_012084 [Erythroxylum novogranatense]